MLLKFWLKVFFCLFKSQSWCSGVKLSKLNLLQIFWKVITKKMCKHQLTDTSRALFFTISHAIEIHVLKWTILDWLQSYYWYIKCKIILMTTESFLMDRSEFCLIHKADFFSFNFSRFAAGKLDHTATLEDLGSFYLILLSYEHFLWAWLCTEETHSTEKNLLLRKMHSGTYTKAHHRCRYGKVSTWNSIILRFIKISVGARWRKPFFLKISWGPAMMQEILTL